MRRAFLVGVLLGILFQSPKYLAFLRGPRPSLTPLDIVEGLLALAIYGLLAMLAVWIYRRRQAPRTIK